MFVTCLNLMYCKCLTHRTLYSITETFMLTDKILTTYLIFHALFDGGVFEISYKSLHMAKVKKGFLCFYFVQTWQILKPHPHRRTFSQNTVANTVLSLNLNQPKHKKCCQQCWQHKMSLGADAALRVESNLLEQADIRKS